MKTSTWYIKKKKKKKRNGGEQGRKRELERGKIKEIRKTVQMRTSKDYQRLVYEAALF